MPNAYEKELEVALEAVRQAARLCRSVRARINVEALEKQDRSPVTVADFGSQALICRALSAAFPDDPVIAEEGAAALRLPQNAALLERTLGYVRSAVPEAGAGADAEALCRWIDHGGARGHAERFWTLDPIDGTKGFLRGGQYAIALALVVEGRLQAAALACPNLPLSTEEHAKPHGRILSARRGQGARVQTLDGASPPEALAVSATADPAAARFCESFEAAHTAHDRTARVAARLGVRAAPLRLDSQAKYALLAQGEADLYLRFPSQKGYRENIWDHAAGALIVSEAGGRVSDWAGRPLEFTHGRELPVHRGIVASNGKLHERVLKALME